MEIFLAGVLTWLLACVASSIYFSHENKRLLPEELQDSYVIALRYLQWVSKKSFRRGARRLSRFLTSPIYLSLYLSVREKTKTQIEGQMKAAIAEAQELMRLRYQGKKPWIHPADLYSFRVKYMEWFHDSQAEAMKKFQRRIRFGMYGKAVHQAKQHLPCQCPQPLRVDAETKHDKCSCGGLLPKDPPSLIL